MYIQLIRESLHSKFTEGKMFINGTFECHTLEDTDRHLEDGGIKINKITAIPRGIYNITITRSNRFKKDLMLLESVPGFTGIRVHSGNTSEDTDGCIIVGSTNKSQYDDWVGGSRVAYKSLHTKAQKALDDGELVTIEVV